VRRCYLQVSTPSCRVENAHEIKTMNGYLDKNQERVMGVIVDDVRSKVDVEY